MNEFLAITTTTGSKQDAEKIAAELVSRRLAGCVQISGPILSTYWWQGKIETAEEWMCTIKTTRDQLDEIQRVVEKLHTYELPEILAVPVVDGSERYLNWLREQVN